MLARRNLSVSGEVSVEHFAVLNTAYVEQPPSGNAIPALPAHLPTEQSNHATLTAVIVRLDNPFVALVSEPEQMFVLNRGENELIQFLIYRHYSLRTPR